MDVRQNLGSRDAASATFAILTGAALGMAALLALLPAAGHDQMWLLYAARLLLRGQPLYGPTIFETNPPLILWMSTIPESLAHLTRLPDTTWGKLWVALVLCAVAALCLRFYRILRPAPSPAVRWALAFTFVTVFAAMPARDFGQRDHFLAIFILPYVVAAAVRARSLPVPRGLAVLVGVLAPAGVVLKPHQLLIPFFVETALLVMRRRPRATLLRPELAAMLASGVLFLGAVRLFAPLYFTVVTPLARETYWAYGGLSLRQLFLQSIQLHVLLAVDLVLAIRLGASPLARMLLVAGLAATCAFYLQGTGWYYQQLPALALLSFALAILLLDRYAEALSAIPRWVPRAAAALALVALALTTHFTGYPFTGARSFPVDTPDPAFFAGLPPGAAVMTLSPTVDDTIQPLFKYHLTLGQRYPAFLMLPALLRAEDPQGKPIPRRVTPAQVAALDRVQRQDMVEDLNRWQPRLILVERCQDPTVLCQVLEDRHDNLLAWFESDPVFATIFAHYRLVGSRGPYDGYERD